MKAYIYLIPVFFTILSSKMIIKILRLKKDFEKNGHRAIAKVEEYKEHQGRVYPFVKFKDGNFEVYSNVIGENINEQTAPVGTEFEVEYLRKEKDGKSIFAVRAYDERFRNKSISSVLNVFYVFFAISFVLTITFFLKFTLKML